MTKSRMVPCSCDRFPTAHFRIKDAEGCRQPSTRPYADPADFADGRPPLPPPIVTTHQTTKVGELKCKTCNLKATPELLARCTRNHCPSLDGGFTDIENATISDMSWVEHAKELRSSKQKTGV